MVLEWWMKCGEGVVLRPWRLDDVPAVTAACQDREIARWLAFVPEPYTEEDARFYIQDCIGAPDDRKPFASPTPRRGRSSARSTCGSIACRRVTSGTGSPRRREAAGVYAALLALSQWAFASLVSARSSW